MNGLHAQIYLTLGVVFGSAGLLLWSAASIRYHITLHHLKITWLGLPVRAIRLDDIKRVGARPVMWAERWPNTLRKNGRLLVIRRKSGWLRHLVITPRFPFEFRNDLEQARKTNGANAPTAPANPSRQGTECHAA